MTLHLSSSWAIRPNSLSWWFSFVFVNVRVFFLYFYLLLLTEETNRAACISIVVIRWWWVKIRRNLNFFCLHCYNFLSHLEKAIIWIRTKCKWNYPAQMISKDVGFLYIANSWFLMWNHKSTLKYRVANVGSKFSHLILSLFAVVFQSTSLL